MNRVNIRFFSEDISYIPKHKKLLRKWIVETLHTEKKMLGTINIIFCSDRYLIHMNKQYLNHDTYTDIITFDYSEDKEMSGDLFISIQRVKENAKTFNKKLIDEVHRVIIHGILHLCGYADKDQKSKLKMRSLEDYYLLLRPLKSITL